MSRDGGNWPYGLIGVKDGETDLRTIRRTYAKRLKGIDPVTSPDEFQRLRQAYEAAQSIASGDDRDTAMPGGSFPPTDDGELQFSIRNLAGVSVDLQLAARVQALTDDGADAQQWSEFLNRVQPDDADARAWIEAQIYDAILQHSTIDEQGFILLPDFIDADLIRVFDQEFGWLSDYRNIETGHGLMREGFHAALAARQKAAPRRTSNLFGETHEPADNLFLRLPWYLQAVVVIGVYIAMRSIFPPFRVSPGIATGIILCLALAEAGWRGNSERFLLQFNLGARPPRFRFVPVLCVSAVVIAGTEAAIFHLWQ